MLVRYVGEAEQVICHVMRLPGEVFELPAGEVRRLTAGGDAQIVVTEDAEALPFDEIASAGEEFDATGKGTAVTNAVSARRKVRK